MTFPLESFTSNGFWSSSFSIEVKAFPVLLLSIVFVIPIDSSNLFKTGYVPFEVIFS